MPVDVSVLTALEATTAIDAFGYTANPISANDGTWTDHVETADGDLKTTGSVVTNVAAAVDATAYRNPAGETYASDMAAMITVTTKPPLGDGLVGIYIALQGAGLGSGTPNGYRGEIRIRTGAGTDEWRIQRLDGASGPGVISSGTIQEISSGDKFAVVRSGSAIELWWKTGSTWSFIVTVTDATYTSGGKIGIHINDLNNAAGTELDDLKAQNTVTAVPSQAPSPPITRIRLRAY